MTEMTETPSATPAEDPRAHNKNLIFAALAEAGILSVTVDYDGSGDSGQIESIEAWDTAHEKIPLPSSRKVQLASDNPDHPLTEINLEAAIETLVYRHASGLGDQRRRFRHLRFRRLRSVDRART